jgi:arylsulfatase
MVGKWQGRDLAVERGFDRFFGPNCQGKISYWNAVQANDFYLDDQRWEFPESGFFMTEAFSDYAAKFLKSAVAGEAPFFLYVAYIAPHWPLHAQEKDIASYRDLYLETGWDEWRQRRFERQRGMGLVSDIWKMAPKPASVHPWKDDPEKDWQAERMAVYAAQIATVDRGIGGLLNILKESGAEEDTLVLFLSDNGAAPDGGMQPGTSGFGFDRSRPNKAWRRDGVVIKGGSGPDHMPGPHDTFAGYGIAWATTSNTPLRDHKQSAYEGGIRTPLIARWPGVIKERGAITQQAGHVIDVMATCLDVSTLGYPDEFKGRHPIPMEGKSLVPIFRGEQREAHEAVGWNCARGQAIRQGKWKLVRPAPGKPWELYDLESDGGETNNLAGKSPDRVDSMALAWESWRKRVGAR